MAAGQQYNKHLNYDQGNVKGAAIYDANLDEWVMLSAQVVKTEGGVLIYQRGTDDGRAKVDAQLTGSNAEVVSAQDAQVSTIAQTYIRAVDATQIEVYVESGYVRVRTDGEAATPTTGEPFGPGYGGAWTVNSISVYYVADSTITVVSR